MHKVHGGRALLNDPGHFSTAAIVAEIQDTEDWPEGENGEGTVITNRWRAEPEVTFQIANCDRSVAFELGFDDDEDFANSLAKLNTMIELLSQLKKGLKIEHRRYVKRMKGAEVRAEEEKSRVALEEAQHRAR